MSKKNRSPYESHDREAICALCKEVKDEKAVKIFAYTGVPSGYQLHINVCRACENKKEELDAYVKDYFVKNKVIIFEGEIK